jgi:hypothetical protein
MFDPGSGRPAGSVIRTPLLMRLEKWVEDLLGPHAAETPRCILLVGGPGNGKTEAVEAVIHSLDKGLAAGGRLANQFRQLFFPPDGQPVPRTAELALSPTGFGPSEQRTLAIVQDASVADPAQPGRTAASLLATDLQKHVFDSASTIYVACVNRGVLDDALIFAINNPNQCPLGLLEAITTAVGLTPAAPPCWPLAGFPSVAIWPMDVESLLTNIGLDGHASPGEQLMNVAVRAESWAPFGTCAAQERCPFCSSRDLLSKDLNKGSLLSILRLYELASGKRWSFRDLFSLYSYLLAGVPSTNDASGTPCESAAKLVSLEMNSTAKPESLRLKAPYLLVASQYQHALFGKWPRAAARRLRADLKDLRLEAQHTLIGLQLFLSQSQGLGVPATLAPQLSSLSDALDPALASPDDELEISSRSTITFRDLDTRFSHSVGEGLQFIRKFRCLTVLELQLLQKLDQADQLLSEPDVQRRRPVTAARVQRFVRDFSCRLVRRTLGVRHGMVRDFSTLKRYRSVIEGDEQLLHDAVKQVESLLNDKDHFVVTLNTTFGESLPPLPRRAILLTGKQRVRARPYQNERRPESTLRFLSVGDGPSTQVIPLTYELFRSVRELKGGMLPPSLPRTVVALLDTTRARLSGRIVRQEDLLDGSEIRIGVRDDVIARDLGKFVVRKEDEQ